MSLGPLGPLIDRLWAQALSLDRKPARSAPAGKARKPSADRSDMDAIIAAVASIPEEAPDRRRRTFRAFLEVTLARELGLRDPGTPGCQDLVDRVMSAVEEQERLRRPMEEVVDLLLARARSPRPA